MSEPQGMNILPKIMIGSLVSLCLFLYDPLITLAQAPPEDIGAPDGAPPEDIGAPPEDIGAPPEDVEAPLEDPSTAEDLGGPLAQNRVMPASPSSLGGEPPGAPPGSLAGPPTNLTAPPDEFGIAPSELVNSGCQSYIYDATIDGNVSSINASALNNRSNEFGTNVYDPRFTLTTSLIAKDLGSLSATEIKDYDLKDISADEMKSVLCNLTSGNLTKVLMNIPVEDLLYVRDKLTSQTFLSILQMLPAENGSQIMNRTTEISP